MLPFTRRVMRTWGIGKGAVAPCHTRKKGMAMAENMETVAKRLRQRLAKMEPSDRMETLAKRLKRRLDVSEEARGFNKREIQRVSGERNALQGKLNEACAKVRELEAQAEAMKARVVELEQVAVGHEAREREAVKEALEVNGEVKKLRGELLDAMGGLCMTRLACVSVRIQVSRLADHLLQVEVDCKNATATTLAEMARRRLEQVERELRHVPVPDMSKQADGGKA